MNLIGSIGYKIENSDNFLTMLISSCTLKLFETEYSDNASSNFCCKY